MSRGLAALRRGLARQRISSAVRIDSQIDRARAARRRLQMGPLQGIKVLEIAGIGPGPFAAMMLSDMGAEVLRIDRAQSVSPSPSTEPSFDLLNRGRRSVGIDLKRPEGVETVLR